MQSLVESSRLNRAPKLLLQDSVILGVSKTNLTKRSSHKSNSPGAEILWRQGWSASGIAYSHSSSFDYTPELNHIHYTKILPIASLAQVGIVVAVKNVSKDPHQFLRKFNENYNREKWQLYVCCHPLHWIKHFLLPSQMPTSRFSVRTVRCRSGSDIELRLDRI